MPVTADGDHVFLRCQERAQFVAFMFEAVVGVVVVFRRSIGADDWRGTDQYAKRRVGLCDGAFEPFLLFFPPDCFVWAVGQIICAAEVAAFDEPDLEVLSPTKCALGLIAHGDLFEKHGLGFREGEFPHVGRLN